MSKTNSWLDKESRVSIACIGFAAIVGTIFILFAPDKEKGPIVTLFAATAAALGWITTNLQNRRFSRIQYTNTQIDHYRNDSEIQRCVILIKEHFLNKTPIDEADIEQLWADYLNSKNYASKDRKAPVLHHIVHILNFFERIAYLYVNQLVDHRLFYRHFNIILGKQMIRLQNVVRRIRREDAGKKSYNDLREMLLEWYDFDIDHSALLTEQTVQSKRIEEFYK
jgi:hypothetical protein